MGGQNLLTRAGRAPDDISSIVLCESDGTSHVKSDAILRIAQLMDIPFRIIRHSGSSFLQGFETASTTSYRKTGTTSLGPQKRVGFETLTSTVVSLNENTAFSVSFSFFVRLLIQ